MPSLDAVRHALNGINDPLVGTAPAQISAHPLADLAPVQVPGRRVTSVMNSTEVGWDSAVAIHINGEAHMQRSQFRSPQPRKEP